MQFKEIVLDGTYVDFVVSNKVDKLVLGQHPGMHLQM
jgi:hypothetical protein